jgi:hypothetical protein
LYECETSPPALREGHRLRVFENMVLRRVFEHVKEEVVGGHKEESHNFYSSPNIIKVIK